MVLTFGSMFAGVGGFDLGFERAGMRGLWQVEIEADCRSVLARHFPKARRFDDVTNVEVSQLEPVDVVCFGFPCQDLSVAGERAGLGGERSGLWFEALRIVAGLEPRWVVVENVPGLLSSWSPVEPPPDAVEGGEWEVEEVSDFETVLAGLTEIGYRVAWRVFDAQFDGVAQRRRRVFLVGSLGDGSCAEILFERESVPWNPPTRGEARPGVAADAQGGIGGDGEPYTFDWQAGSSGDTSFRGKARSWLEDKPGRTRSLTANRTLAVCNSIDTFAGGPDDNAAQSGHIVAANNFGERDVETSLSTSNERMDGDTETFVVAPCLRSNQHNNSDPAMEAQMLVGWHENKSGQLTPTDTAKALRSGASHSYQGVGVRRLTPRECERLQGFPDDFTAWGVNEKGERVSMSDSARYRQLGNAVCVNVAKWIGDRIVKVTGNA
ncbi:MAG TPA: DNA (cytosine-5-)-methyltransferase [Pyrinomonadaceae bacterium]|nr:DNA (cytosine-5-)-methyltransferase [Pyrinomonadaceae bacterium]